MGQKTVILGMSGGVDSSVAALLLKQQGYKVIGVFMKNFSDTKNKFTGECWWQEELRIARSIANMLDIEFQVVDYESQYKNKVIKPMIKSYASGKTPNPDVECNNETKFPALLAALKSYQADFIATGHYAQVKQQKGTFVLMQGKDMSKDQSYFLYKLTQKELSKTLFPLGSVTKEQVRKIAQENDFPNWDKHGSAGVCFIGNIPLQDYLKQHIKSKPGKVINENHEIIGTHQGANFYTIGQRVGEHVGIVLSKYPQLAQKRFYIAQKMPDNMLLVAPEGSEILKRKEVSIKKLYSPSNNIIKAVSYKARYRHLGPLIPGKLIKSLKGWKFIFSKPQEAIAEGQSLVLYKGKQLVAGGEMSI
jgi:tRNA-uridine 2-sulfurtransferase